MLTSFLCRRVQSNTAPRLPPSLLLGKQPRSRSQGMLLPRETSQLESREIEGGKLRPDEVLELFWGGVKALLVVASLCRKAFKGVENPFAALAASASGSDGALSLAKRLFPTLPAGTEPWGRCPLLPGQSGGEGAGFQTGGLGARYSAGADPATALPALGRHTRAKFGRNKALSLVGRFAGGVPASLPGGELPPCRRRFGRGRFFSAPARNGAIPSCENRANGDT